MAFTSGILLGEEKKTQIGTTKKSRQFKLNGNLIEICKKEFDLSNRDCYKEGSYLRQNIA